jgi:hypothetical protein
VREIRPLSREGDGNGCQTWHGYDPKNGGGGNAWDAIN